HCGGGCQPNYSLINSANSSTASCLVQRPGGQQCVSGMYTFDNNTWLLRVDAYNGNPKVADFTIDPQTLDAQNVVPNSGGSGTYLRIVRPNPLTVNGAQQGGVGARLSSTSYLPLGGKACARVRQSGAKGIITAFILMADNKDEVDFEWTGKSSRSTETNWFGNGVRDYGNSATSNNTETVAQSHEYCILYEKDKVTWTVDGVSIRSTGPSPGKYFPQNPARVQISIWDAQTVQGGTVSWAGGVTDWGQSNNGAFFALFDYIKIQCPGDAEPTGPPTRPAGYTKPDINGAPKIDSVVDGTPDYVPNTVGTQAALPSANPSGGIVPQGTTAGVGRDTAFVAATFVIGAFVCSLLSLFA
ncbi:concanavalin A-like lectin/glucanase domain-containing protein, partial [Cladochytrium replicatum]